MLVLRHGRLTLDCSHAFRDGTYLVPNDDSELQRLDLQHNQWRLTLDGRLFIAPIPSPISSPYQVLDIGTGTGLWAIEFADEQKEASVTGVDLSPVQPTFVPPNCSFLVDDIEYDWLYDHPFHYIHGRFLSMGIRDWSRVFQQSYKALFPGGWVEYQEAELIFSSDPNSPKPNPEMRSLSDDVQDAATKIGVDIRQAHGWKQAIEDAGFINHKMVNLRWPIGGEWCTDSKYKAIGRMNRLNMLNGIEGLSLAYLVRIRGDDPDAVRQRLERVRAEMKDPDVWMWMDL
jgi:SAM-dependent methyltransferase